MGELTKPQLAMLRYYDDHGPTQQTYAHGTMNTWRSLLRKGLLSRSNGLGPITTEVTEAGHRALQHPGEDER